MNSASATAAKSLQWCPTLCNPIPGILQARTLEWVAIFLLQCIKVKSESEVAQSCLTLPDPMDCSLPGSSVHGIFQARALEWGAIAFSGSASSTELILHSLSTCTYMYVCQCLCMIDLYRKHHYFTKVSQ